MSLLYTDRHVDKWIDVCTHPCKHTYTSSILIMTTYFRECCLLERSSSKMNPLYSLITPLFMPDFENVFFIHRFEGIGTITLDS